MQNVSNIQQIPTNQPSLMQVLILPLGTEQNETDALALAAKNPNPWILNPALDLLFVCGGLVWIFNLLHTVAAQAIVLNPVLQIQLMLVVIGTHIFAEGHITATLARVYRNDTVRESLSAYTYWAALGCASLILAGLYVPGMAGIIAKIYLLWVVQHFTAQTFGIGLVYCYKRGYYFKNSERMIFSLLMNSTAAHAIIQQLTVKSIGSAPFMGIAIPFWGSLPGWILTASTYFLISSAIVFTAVVVKKFLRDKQIMPLPAILTILTGILIFTIGFDAGNILWLYVPIFYHGSQYLAISTSIHLKEHGLPQNTSHHDIAKLLTDKPALRYFGLIALLAIGIFIGVPRILEQLGFNYTIAFVSVFCSVSIHHFITDQAIWKLRDKKTRDALLA